MEVRDLQGIVNSLSPSLKAKKNTQYIAWDGFTELFSQKSNEASKGNSTPNTTSFNKTSNSDEILKSPDYASQFSTKNPMLTKVVVAESNRDDQQLKIETAKPSSYDSPVKTDQVNEKAKDAVETKEPSEASQKTDEVSESSETKKDSIQNETVDELKDKLKKALKIGDEELEKLMAMMNVSLQDLKQIVENPDMLVSALKEISQILQTLEIDMALEQKMSKSDVEAITKSLEKIVQKLENAINFNEKSSNVALEKGMAFEAKLAEALKPVISLLQNETAELQNPADVMKVIKSILTNETASNPLLTKTLDTNAGETQSNQSSMGVESAKTIEVQTNGSDMSKSSSQNLAQQSETPVQQTLTTDSKNIEVEVDPDVKMNVVFHQTAMKQSNSVVMQNTIQNSQMKQEIMTQFLDAIKGQMKLVDHGSSLIVKLQPEQLGNVELKLNIQKGVVLAEIKVENEIVKAAIESNLDDLKQSLSNKGYSVDQINVNVDSGKKERQEAFEFNQNRQRNENKKETEAVEEISSIESSVKYRYDDEVEGSVINYYG